MPSDISSGSYRLPVSGRSGRDRTTASRRPEIAVDAGLRSDGTVLLHRSTIIPHLRNPVTPRDQERIRRRLRAPLTAPAASLVRRGRRTFNSISAGLGFDST